ncbi:Pheophorbide a oxygenase [Arachis hypogaea]|nr:Pheophorbide a oxygenase [Arachis hypogaea]
MLIELLLPVAVSITCWYLETDGTLWDGGWLLCQLLPYSESEFNSNHLKMVTGRRDRAKPLPFKMDSSGPLGFAGANEGNPRVRNKFIAPCYYMNKKLADNIVASGYYVVILDFFYGEPSDPQNTNRPSGIETISYFGPVSAANKFFSSNGFPCPSLQNPPDHFAKIINKDFEHVGKGLDQKIKKKRSVGAVGNRVMTGERDVKRYALPKANADSKMRFYETQGFRLKPLPGSSGINNSRGSSEPSTWGV